MGISDMIIAAAILAAALFLLYKSLCKNRGGCHGCSGGGCCSPKKFKANHGL